MRICWVILVSAAPWSALAQSTSTGLPALKEDLAAEVQSRQAADSDVATIAKTYTDGKYATEVSARAATDASLDSRIDREASELRAMLGMLQADIVSQAAMTTSLRGSLDLETAERRQRDESLLAATTAATQLLGTLTADLAHANARITALLADRRIAVIAARSGALFEMIVRQLNEVPPDATAVDPVLLNNLRLFQGETTALSSAATDWLQACRTTACALAEDIQRITDLLPALEADLRDVDELLDLQVTMDRTSKLILTVGNIMKKISDTQDTIAANLK